MEAAEAPRRATAPIPDAIGMIVSCSSRDILATRAIVDINRREDHAVEIGRGYSARELIP